MKEIRKGWTRDDKANEKGRKELKQSDREEEELSPQPPRGVWHGEGRSCEVTAGATPAWVSFTDTRLPAVKSFNETVRREGIAFPSIPLPSESPG